MPKKWVYRSREIKPPKKSWWTLVALNREGLPVSPGGQFNNFVQVHKSEKVVTEDIENMWKLQHELMPSDVYVIGIWPGQLSSRHGREEIERIKPKFYVYEGGNTHVVA